MSKRVLHISADLSLPLDAITSTAVIYGGKGMGKTNLGSVLCEELQRAKVRWSFIDPMGVGWGLRYSADGDGKGIECLILGGPKGDIPIEPTGGALVADLVVDYAVNVVIDISRKANGDMWSISDRIKFVTDYGRQLYRRQGGLVKGQRREPICQIIDEAARFIPQTIRQGDAAAAQCESVWSTLVEEGRNVGIGVWMITQRGARINKNVAELADVMLAFRTVGPNSLRAVLDWLGEHIDKERIKDIATQVRSLPRGSALVVSPGWLGIEKVVPIRMRETFDSSATPKAGEKAKRVKGDGARPDLEVFASRMQETIERAAQEDPKALRKRIGELEAELKKKLAAVAAAPAVVHKNADSEKVRMLTAQVKQLEKTAGAYDRQMGRILTMAGSLIQTGNQIREAVEQAQGAAKEAASEPLALPAPDSRPAPAVAHRAPAAPRAATVAPVSDGGPVGAIKGVALKVASIAAGYDGQPVKRAIMAAMCGVSDGGSFSARLSEAKTAGAIVIEGGCISATQEGIEAYAGRFQAPTTTDDVLAIWRPKLGTIQNKILDVLVGMGGESISVAALAEALGASAGGSFSARISEVRSTGLLVDTARGQLAANKEALFL